MKRFYLKDIRKRQGKSIEDVAYAIEISYNYLLNIENGHQGDQASFILMGKLASEYQISMDALYILELEYQRQKGKII
ncbi:MAG: helix-turn-helix transcriptional regulator [Bacillota bacterium]